MQCPVSQYSTFPHRVGRIYHFNLKLQLAGTGKHLYACAIFEPHETQHRRAKDYYSGLAKKKFIVFVEFFFLKSGK